MVIIFKSFLRGSRVVKLYPNTQRKDERRKMWLSVATLDISNRRIQMIVRILKIPPVFVDLKVFTKANVVYDEPSILRSQSYFK